MDEQNGFRVRRGCIDHHYTLASVIRNRINQSKSTFAAFIDFQKAFDSIDRDLLFYKLMCNNITGKIYRGIKSMYIIPKSFIKVNSHYSGWFECPSGVKQGQVLSPTLFSVFINNLAVDIKSMKLGVSFGNKNISIIFIR